MRVFGGAYRRDGGYYHVRVRVPKDLLHIINCREIKRSLRTTDAHHARQLALAWRQQLEEFFAFLRRHYVDNDEIKALCQRYLRSVLDRDMAAVPTDTHLDGKRIDFPTLYAQLVAKDVENINKKNYYSITRLVDTLLEGAETTVSPDSDAYKRLCREVLKTRKSVNEVLLERCNGNWDNWYDRHSSKLLDSSPSTPKSKEFMDALAEIKAQVTGTGGLLVDLLNQYETSDRLSETSQRKGLPILRQFVEYVGNRDISEVGPDVVENYLAKIVPQLPVNRNKSPRYAGRGIHKILEKGVPEEDRLAKNTINDHKRYVKGFFKYCTERGSIKQNPTAAVKARKRARTAPSSKKPFYSDDELKTLFERLPVSHQRPDLYWVTVIAMYSGARQAEICQLYVDDILERDGIWYMRIREFPERLQFLKDEENYSERDVPLHPLLIELGLLNYVAEMQGHVEGRLWPRLKFYDKRSKEQREEAAKNGVNGKGDVSGYAHYFSKWYNEHFNRKYVTQDAGKTFKSFRDRVINFMHAAKVQGNVRRRTVGHAPIDVHDEFYLDPPPLAVTLEALKHVKYADEIEDLIRSRSLWAGGETAMVTAPKSPSQASQGHPRKCTNQRPTTKGKGPRRK